MDRVRDRRERILRPGWPARTVSASARWPWAIGAGTTLRLKWPVDFRVRYFRSRTDWVVVAENLRLDYRYTASGRVHLRRLSHLRLTALPLDRSHHRDPCGIYLSLL